jgi:hypothetical protein
MSPAAKIAAIAGLGAVGKIAFDLITNMTGEFGKVLTDQVKFAGSILSRSVSNPGGISGTEFLSQAANAGTGAVKGIAPIIGARLGAGMGTGLITKAGSFIGGRVAGSATGAAAGGLIGSSIAPVIGTIIGIKVGEMIGDALGSTVGTIVDTLKSIDEGIQELGMTISPFSPDLMGAIVEGDIARLEAQMRQADILGEALAENFRARSNLEIAFMGLGTEVALALEPALTKLYEVLIPVVNFMSGTVKGTADTVNGLISIQQWLEDHYLAIPYLQFLELLAQIGRNTAAARETPDMMREIDEFLNPATANQSFPRNVGAFRGFII